MAERIWDIQGFSGGESDDITRGPKDSFFAAENMEIRKSLSGAQLSSKLVDTTWSISGDIIYMKNLADLGLSGIVVCTSTGKIYLDGTLKTTFATGTNAYNRVIGIGTVVVSGTQYLYYVSQTASGTGKIHRSTTNLGTFDVSYISFATASLTSPFCGVIMNNGNMYFGINNHVFLIDTAGVAATDLITLPATEEIKGFTQFQNNFKIYTTYGNTGVQYASWAGSTAQPLYRQEWINQPVLSVVSNGAFDYAILGYNQYYSDLYLIQGTQKQEIRVNLEASSTGRTLEGYMSIREDIVYISGGNSGGSSNFGIYTYGNYYPGIPKSLVQQYSLSTSRFNFHVHSTSLSYFANNDNKVYTVEHNNPPSTNKYATSGYITSHLYEGNIWEEKSLKKIKVGFKLNADEIKIYLRTEINSSWSLAKTISYATYGSKKGCTIYENEIQSLGLGNFYTLQIKAELIYSGTVFTGPQSEIKRITTFMDIVNSN